MRAVTFDCTVLSSAEALVVSNTHNRFEHAQIRGIHGETVKREAADIKL